jgi:hypothetical protein
VGGWAGGQVGGRASQRLGACDHCPMSCVACCPV